MMNSYRAGWLLLFGFVSIPSDLLAADSTPEQRAAHRLRMAELSQTVVIEELTGDKPLPAARGKQPLLVYTDNTRQQADATLWVWTRQNRPVAVMAVELYPHRPSGPQWLFEVVSLSDHRISAVRAPELRWTSREPAMTWQPLDMDPPATTPARRLIQMREAVRQFRVFESAVVEGQLALRPMTTPLLRYEHADFGVLDGAMFAFANGTNPEVLVLIEARRSKGGTHQWQYRLGQMTGGAVTVEYRDNVVWQQGEADPPAERASYVNCWVSAGESPTSSKAGEAVK
ncbi:MAG TPA: hypothetical protein VM165_09290 [Planctomycetaceae bacterium]|nr:hypothetical protein [Planctomycetaceae bacterium]